MSDEGPMSDDEVQGVTWGALADETAERLAVSSLPEVSGPARAHGRLIAMRAAGAETGEWPDRSRDLATVRGVASLDQMVARRLQGEPLQYVLGEWGFRHLDLFVDRRVLIPRPETEVVAGLALVELERQAASSSDPNPNTNANPNPNPDPVSGPGLVVADLGTGSGAIGLSLATEFDGADVWLTDNSADALAVARANLAGLGRAAARVRVAQGSWFEALPAELHGGLAVVVSNPPYVGAAEVLPAEVGDWEPNEALVSGPAGTEHLQVLVAEAPQWLRPGGALVLEMAPHQTTPIASAAERQFDDVDIHPDLAGRPRAVVARHPRGRPA